MNDKVKGIVLRIADYKDNDQMLQVITENFGVLSLIGKSSKKISSKQHFFESCLYEFIIDYKEGKTIFSIHGSKLIQSYYDLNDSKLFAYKNILFDIIYKSKELYEHAMYKNILFVLDNINNDNEYLLGSLFVSYMSKVHGINPNVDECVVCKNKKVVAISNNLGGFLCLDHINGENIQDVNTLKRFRLVAKADFKDYDIIKENVYSFNDFKLLMDFFCANSSLVFKTYEFYKKII